MLRSCFTDEVQCEIDEMGHLSILGQNCFPLTIFTEDFLISTSLIEMCGNPDMGKVNFCCADNGKTLGKHNNNINIIV